jgi:hypothetical protein
MVILADGEVMAVGGTQQGDDPTQAVLAGEIWDPGTRQWTTVASMDQPRMYHSAALLLPDGRVLAAGGETTTAGPDNPKMAQIYSPPYLFKGPRPTIGDAAAAVGYGGTFTVGTPDSASITTVALIRPGAVTHALNMEQRYVPLSFTKMVNGLSIGAPANGNWAPPGWYMLVIENANGVPSVARWIQVGAGFPLQAGPAVGPPLPEGAPTSGAPPAGAAPGPSVGGGQPSTQAPRAGATLSLPSRISRRALRARGLRMVIRIYSRLTARHPVARVRLRRVITSRSRRLVATAYRRSPQRGTLRVSLRSPVLRRLRPGRYEVEVAVGNSRYSLRAPQTRRFTLIR